VLAEIARLLKENPALKLQVVGHTDSVGGVDPNVVLSKSRAAAVVKALTAPPYGIAPGRLTPQGVGPLVPLSTNKSEQGRAKNRRVDLVEL
jgi:outer membrane protein OmpA-like peptidoglycan-associated protein